MLDGICTEEYERQKDMTSKDEPSRSVGGQYATEEERRNSSGKNEEAALKQEWIQLWMCLVVKVKSDAVKNILHRNLEF